MPWSCGALLPAEQRYTSHKFRRFARRFDATRLGFDDAAELVAFVETVDGVRHARRIFQWGVVGEAEAGRLVTHMKQFPQIDTMVRENHEALTRAAGLAVLGAMQDGGWRHGSVPAVVRMALLDMRDAGMSQEKVGLETGLTREQVRTITVGHRNGRFGKGLGVAGLFAA